MHLQCPVILATLGLKSVSVRYASVSFSNAHSLPPPQVLCVCPKEHALGWVLLELTDVLLERTVLCMCVEKKLESSLVSEVLAGL